MMVAGGILFIGIAACVLQASLAARDEREQEQEDTRISAQDARQQANTSTQTSGWVRVTAQILEAKGWKCNCKLVSSVALCDNEWLFHAGFGGTENRCCYPGTASEEYDRSLCVSETRRYEPRKEACCTHETDTSAGEYDYNFVETSFRAKAIKADLFMECTAAWSGISESCNFQKKAFQVADLRLDNVYDCAHDWQGNAVKCNIVNRFLGMRFGTVVLQCKAVRDANEAPPHDVKSCVLLEKPCECCCPHENPQGTMGTWTKIPQLVESPPGSLVYVCPEGHYIGQRNDFAVKESYNKDCVCFDRCRP